MKQLGKQSIRKMKMKKTICLIFFLTAFTSVFSQTINEAFDFIKEREHDWACEPNAANTLEKRNTFKLTDGELIIKTRMPEFGYGSQSPIKYYECTIDLSKVKSITWSGNSSKSCSGINIRTHPGGLVIKFYDRSGISTYQPKVSQKGICDSIRIAQNSETSERAKRLIKALQFLAESYGAKIVDSNF